MKWKNLFAYKNFLCSDSLQFGLEIIHLIFFISHLKKLFFVLSAKRICHTIHIHLISRDMLSKLLLHLMLMEILKQLHLVTIKMHHRQICLHNMGNLLCNHLHIQVHQQLEDHPFMVPHHRLLQCHHLNRMYNSFLWHLVPQLHQLQHLAYLHPHLLRHLLTMEHHLLVCLRPQRGQIQSQLIL